MRVNSLHLPLSCPPESATFSLVRYHFMDFMLSIMEDGTKGKCTLTGYKISCLKYIYIYLYLLVVVSWSVKLLVFYLPASSILIQSNIFEPFEENVLIILQTNSPSITFINLPFFTWHFKPQEKTLIGFLFPRIIHSLFQRA